MNYFRSGLLVANLLFLTRAVYAQKAEILDFSFDEGGETSQCILSFSSIPEYNVFILDNPPRLVIDLFDAKPANTPIQPPTKHPAFIRLRYSQRNKTDFRLVLDLNKPVNQDNPVTAVNQSENGMLIVQLNYQAQNTNIEPLTHKMLLPLKIIDTPSTSNVKMDLTRSSDEIYKAEPVPILASKTPLGAGDGTDTLFSNWEISGYVGAENLGFFNDGTDSRQHNNYVSGVIQPEIYRRWDNDKQSFTFVPFYRYSQHDNRRTHFDIRELTWEKATDRWELRVGFHKVFWGVTEGIHLVDIINQTDFVENTDGEDKLGQPMINFAWVNDLGTLDLFFLTGFRERTFPGIEGRLRTDPMIDMGEAQFERHGAEKHLAYAARWSQSFGDWDIGLAHFHGTARQPTIVPTFDTQGELTQLIPYYDYIDQTSLDVQVTQGSWLWKLESLVRLGQGSAIFAATGGVEYTFFDLFESGLDLGVVVEYMYDSRGYNNMTALTQQTIFQDDILTALRFGFNDVQDSQILAGVIFDRTHNTKLFSVEASRRIGDNWKAELELRLFNGIPASDPVFMFKDDDHIRAQLSYYF
ncbi:AMIN domain-containing protein [Methylicorpusculum sp.]|uniref:AMIN domain-containing protein n=1 Tax=Methylicorpusculum sp. TaxID=2713644 RepID=UPI00271CB381|nr:AMIN domain-containing protein [Methylicorpusculum sp.]MDO8844074.1 AMIN domain-containing protein [Methylicorpusculum sp.]